jgi:hypothetical protein
VGFVAARRPSQQIHSKSNSPWQGVDEKGGEGIITQGGGGRLLGQINIAMMIDLGFIMWRINVATFERRVIAFTIQSAGEVIKRSVMSILICRSSVVLCRSVEYYSTPCVSNIQYLYIYVN